MSEHQHPVIMCDGIDDGIGCMWGAVELDHTLGGLGHLVGSDTQLPDGWTGPEPGSRSNDPHLCPRCTEDTKEASDD